MVATFRNTNINEKLSWYARLRPNSITFQAYPRVKKGPLVKLLNSDWGIFDLIGGT